jgi:hypothetical protein
LGLILTTNADDEKRDNKRMDFFVIMALQAGTSIIPVRTNLGTCIVRYSVPVPSKVRGRPSSRSSSSPMIACRNSCPTADLLGNFVAGQSFRSLITVAPHLSERAHTIFAWRTSARGSEKRGVRAIIAFHASADRPSVTQKPRHPQK